MLPMKIGLLFLALLFTSVLQAQFTISGRVVDAQSGAALEGASVFAQSTSVGTITTKEGRFELSLPRGGYEVVISFTGYQTGRITVSEAKGDITIQLQQIDKSMEAVVITASNEVADGWEKYGSMFLAQFIGTTPLADSCSLLNPEALKFYYYKRTDRVKVLAAAPLHISNRSLGYNLTYTLDSFVHYNKTGISTYQGACLYADMQAENAQEQQRWNSAREATYKGSRLQFVRSYYNGTLKEDGYTVDVLSRTDKNKFNRLTNPYDTLYYNVDSTDEPELWFEDKISISYYKKAPEARYLKESNLPPDVKLQISYVTLLDPVVLKENGFFSPQRAWVNGGYWSWKNLADALPYDYYPPEQ